MDILSDVEEEALDSKEVLKEDMDKVIAELTQAVMKSKNVTTLNRAMNSRKNSNSTNSDIESQHGGKSGSSLSSGILRNSIRKIKRASGIEAVKDLWLQTGMKTNGMISNF